MDEDKELTEGLISNEIKRILNKAVNIYGLEGTEQKIKECYINTPKIQELMLKEYKEKIKGGLR